jgi:hypothetical protein
MEQLAFPIIYVMAHLGLIQEFILLGILLLSPQYLLTYRYVWMLEAARHVPRYWWG